MSYTIIDRALSGPKHAREAKHARPRKAGRVAVVIGSAVLVGSAAAATMAGFTSTQPAGTPWVGRQAAVVLASVNWTEITCGAFARYEARPSSGHMQAVVVDSLNLGRSYLKADVLQWAADNASPSSKAAKYAAKDPGYVGKDCAS